jgi:hypothetical protein
VINRLSMYAGGHSYIIIGPNMGEISCATSWEIPSVIGAGYEAVRLFSH